MKNKVIVHPEVQKCLADFVFAELYTDKGPEQHENERLLNDRFASFALPLYATLSPDGVERSRLVGVASRAEFLKFLKKGLEAPASSTR